jgi:hypothetical protein
MKGYFKDETIIITLFLCGTFLFASLLCYIVTQAATYERIVVILLITVLLISTLSFCGIFALIRNLKKSAGQSSGNDRKLPCSSKSESQEISKSSEEQ